MLRLLREAPRRVREETSVVVWARALKAEGRYIDRMLAAADAARDQGDSDTDAYADNKRALTKQGNVMRRTF